MRVRNIKQRMRFYAFLNCAKIIEIARRANTTRQNIHKQFNRICYRVAKSIAQSAPSDRVYTPARLKKKYQELKPTP
jgi:butyrate kinase